MPARILCCLGLLATYWAIAFAAERAAAAEETEAGSLTTRLKSDAFSERQEATVSLKRLGSKAIPSLIDVARGQDADSRSRALGILEEHLRRGEPPLQEGAKLALEQLAKGTGPEARAAQRILNPPPPPDFNEFRRRVAGLQVMQAQARVQIQRPGLPINPMIPQLPAGPARSISISVSENGRTIRIQKKDDRIEIEVTESRNGQKVVDKYEAKSVDDLKANHPQGYKIYQEYGPRFGLLPAAKIESKSDDRAEPQTKPAAK